MGHRTVLLPSLDMWDVLLKPGYRAVLHEDNQPTKRIIEKQSNPTMRHLPRSHRISLKWLFEHLGSEGVTRDPVDIIYTQSRCMAADIYTKGFSDPVKWANATRLINVLDPVDLEAAMLRHSETGSTSLIEPNPCGAEGQETVRLPAGAFKFPNVASRLYEPRSGVDAKQGTPVKESRRFAEVAATAPVQWPSCN